MTGAPRRGRKRKPDATGEPGRQLVPVGPVVIEPEPAGPTPEEVEAERRRAQAEAMAQAVAAEERLAFAHAPEDVAGYQRVRPEDIDPEKIDLDWIKRRLAAEAMDFGARTRQSARVSALKTLGELIAATKEPGRDNPFDKMDPFERRELLKRRAMELLAKGRGAGQGAPQQTKD